MLIIECQGCGKKAAVQPCPGCQAVYFCSKQHCHLHRKLGHAGEECIRMKRQKLQAHELRDFPFTWTQQLTAGIDSGSTSLCAFLSLLGLHSQLTWSLECSCGPKNITNISHPSADFPTCSPISADGFGLDFIELPQKEFQGYGQLDDFAPDLQNWSDYYRWRSLLLDHPAAIVLSTVLTLFCAVGWCLRHLDCDRLPAELSIHLLGSQKEVYQSCLLEELRHLMPGCSFHIHLIGPHVPRGLPLRSLGQAPSGVTVSFHSGLYHEVLPELKRQPNLIFAPNAGITAYTSWKETLQRLPEDAPLVVTDFCEEAAIQAARACQHASGRRQAMQVVVNAFRKPVSCCDSGNALPSYGNGFMFAFV